MNKGLRRSFAIWIAAVFCIALALPFAQAYEAMSWEVYDPDMDYISAMREAAEDGTPAALRYGRFCELCRNIKIHDLDLHYDETDFFDGRDPAEIVQAIDEYMARYAMVYVGRFYITGYDICVACCGKTDGITYSGTQATVGRTCGASFKWPIGTEFYIDGIGYRTVEDRGRLTSDYHLDVLCNNHDECGAITRYYDVWKVGE